MQQPMQQQHADLVLQGVAKPLCLAGCGLKRDGEIARELWPRRVAEEDRCRCRGKGEHICCHILAAKCFVEPLQRRVVGKQHVHFAHQTRRSLRTL